MAWRIKKLKMVEKTVTICDVCRKSIAKTKCPFCEKDICEDCSDELLEAGTVLLKVCEGCLNKIKNTAQREKDFWKEFNQNENMENKLIIYIKKKLILNNLGDEETDEDEEYDNTATNVGIYKLKKGAKRRIGQGSWAKAMARGGSRI
jgi:hypothetical protein